MYLGCHIFERDHNSNESCNLNVTYMDESCNLDVKSYNMNESCNLDVTYMNAFTSCITDLGLFSTKELTLEGAS